MANHVRRQIREAVGTVLTGLSTTGARVFQSRAYPLEQTDLPGLLISTASESVEYIDIAAPATQQRTLTVRVDALAKATADLDDVLDGICKEVEVALASPGATLAALAKSIMLAAVDVEVDASGAQPIGRASMEYRLVYFVYETAPDVAL